MQRGDGGLRLVFAQAISGQGRLQDQHRLGDVVGAPQTAILVGEGHQAAVGANAGRPPGVVQQEPCQ